MPILSRLTAAFPVWAVLASAIALWRPEVFTWFSGPMITYGLGVIMLGMGVTLTTDDFRRVFRLPRLVALGVVLQYTVMPLLGWGLAALYNLPTPLRRSPSGSSLSPAAPAAPRRTWSAFWRLRTWDCPSP